MLLKHLFTAASALSCAYASPNGRLAERDLTSNIDAEYTRSLQGVLDNLGPDGALAPGAAAGILVASPSTVNPDCKMRTRTGRTSTDIAQTTILGPAIVL